MQKRLYVFLLSSARSLNDFKTTLNRKVLLSKKLQYPLLKIMPAMIKKNISMLCLEVGYSQTLCVRAWLNIVHTRISASSKVVRRYVRLSISVIKFSGVSTCKFMCYLCIFASYRVCVYSYVHKARQRLAPFNLNDVTATAIYVTYEYVYMRHSCLGS